MEAIFGKNGHYIPHVESTSRTLLQVTHWHPEENAEILIFGPAYYQEDVSQMISNLVNYYLDFFYREVTLGQLQQGCPGKPASSVCAGIKGVCATATQLMLFF